MTTILVVLIAWAVGALDPNSSVELKGLLHNISWTFEALTSLVMIAWRFPIWARIGEHIVFGGIVWFVTRGAMYHLLGDSRARYWKAALRSEKAQHLADNIRWDARIAVYQRKAVQVSQNDAEEIAQAVLDKRIAEAKASRERA